MGKWALLLASESVADLLDVAELCLKQAGQVDDRASLACTGIGRNRGDDPAQQVPYRSVFDEDPPMVKSATDLIEE